MYPLLTIVRMREMNTDEYISTQVCHTFDRAGAWLGNTNYPYPELRYAAHGQNLPQSVSFLARVGCPSGTTELEEPYTDADEDRPKSFWDTRIEVDPCCDVIRGEPLEVTIWFKTDGIFSETDTLYVDLPSEYAVLIRCPEDVLCIGMVPSRASEIGMGLRFRST